MKRFRIFAIFAVALLAGASARAQLAVSVLPVKMVGQKTIVQLKMKNEFTEKIESARAVCVVLNERGKMVCQSTKWVVGQDKKALAPKGEAKYNFVITILRSLASSNLTAKVIFNRVILDGGKSVDPRQEVEIIAGTGDDKSNSH
jgi:hypothetical protein